MPIWRLACIVLLATAVALRLHWATALDSVFTVDWNSYPIFTNQPFPVRTFLTTGAKLAALMLREYMVPVWLLLLPAAVGLARLGPWPHPNISIRNRLLALIVGAFGVLIGCHFWVWKSSPLCGDEDRFLFQASILRGGHLTAAAPPQPDYWRADGLVFEGGRWYTRYPIGWPLLLALLPSWARFLVAPALSAASLYLLFLLARDLFDEQTGWLATLLWAISPFFLLNGSAFFSHVAAVFWLLLTCYHGLHTARGGGTRSRLWFAAALTGLILTRPQDAPPTLALLLLMRGRQGRTAMVVMGAGLLVGVLLTMGVNQAQNGAPLRFAYQACDPQDHWGFGPHGHSPIRALWNTMFSMGRLVVWMPALFCELSLVGLFPLRRSSLFLVLGVLLNVGVYAGYHTLGVMEYGPRYYYPTAALLSPLAARGLLRAGDWVGTSVAVVVFSLLVAVSPLRLAANEAERVTYPRQIESFLLRQAPRTLAFVVSSSDGTNADWVRNPPDLSAPTLFVYYLEDSRNRELMRSFPDRKPFLVSWNAQSNAYVVESYQTKLDAPHLMRAALNYVVALEEGPKAVPLLQMVIELDPGATTAYCCLGNIAYTQHDRMAAVAYWQKALQLNPSDSSVRFALAQTLWESGRRDESLREYATVASQAPDTPQGGRARAYLKLYHASSGQ